jgi:Bacterial Ig-like domain (group 3)
VTAAAVTLTATVSCVATCTPVGTVGFWDGGSVQVGTSQTVVSGSATVSTTTLSIGSSHSFVAIFTPTDQTAFTTSQSAAVPYSITSTDSGSATVTDSAGTALGSDPTLAPGQTVTVQASGFTAGETVTATVHSVPVTLTPSTATATGAIAYAFTVPASLPAGAHTLVLAGATSAHTVTLDFSIAAPSVLGTTTATPGSASLPFTGADLELLTVVALICLCVGFVIRFGGPEPRRVGVHERHGPGLHARVGAKHSRH